MAAAATRTSAHENIQEIMATNLREAGVYGQGRQSRSLRAGQDALLLDALDRHEVHART
jgi:hypothetical protein